MSIDEEDYEQLTLFNKKGFSRNWNDIDLRKNNTYGDLDFGGDALSEVPPDLDYEEMDAINDAKNKDCLTEHQEMEDPEVSENPNANELKEQFRLRGDIDEANSQNQVIEQMEEIKSEGRPASEHAPINKHLLSSESFEFKKADTMAQSKETLKEKIDDRSHVKNCLNRKDVVVKSILRSMRKYYADLVQDNSEYKRKIRNIGLKHKTLIGCSLSLARILSLSNWAENVAFYLTAIAFPNDLKKILAKATAICPENKSEFALGLNSIDVIENAMTRYSKKVMNNFMRIPEIWYLLLNYLSKVKNNEYKEHYDMLKEMANQTLHKETDNETSAEEKPESKVIKYILSQ